MLKSFTARNFRCFRDLTVEPLARVNLIAGKNNAGKTALLEAIFLHLGPSNPQLPLVINALRGVHQVSADPDRIWGALFRGKETDASVELSSTDVVGVVRTLRLRLTESETVRAVPASETTVPSNGGALQTQGAGPATTALGARDLLLEYEDTAGGKGTSRAFVAANEVKLQQARLGPLPVAIFRSTRDPSAHDEIDMFSRLEERGEVGAILGALRLLEPRLQRLSVLVSAGVPMVWGDVGMGRLLPLAFMGEGMMRLLATLLTIARAAGGAVLVDEIENGIHYSVMQDVWRAIGEAARRNDTQVFATTHSYECIAAAHEAFGDSEPYDLRVHRLERVDDEIRSVTLDQEMLEGVLASGWEVR
ncbi:MAG: AAA family ATPase [Armatimonadetes bacterium]|nr:AAA family ATPase [Armatimonadota bacterium]